MVEGLHKDPSAPLRCAQDDDSGGALLLPKKRANTVRPYDYCCKILNKSQNTLVGLMLGAAESSPTIRPRVMVSVTEESLKASERFILQENFICGIIS